MKFHKIRNVDESVCTAEQKIAYNYAFSYRDVAKRVPSDELDAMVERAMQRNDKIAKVYDIGLVMQCFRNGMPRYMSECNAILGSYAEIGKVFKI